MRKVAELPPEFKSISESQVISIFDPVASFELGELMAGEYSQIDFSVGADGYLHSESTTAWYDDYFETLNKLCPPDWTVTQTASLVETPYLHGRVTTPVDNAANRFANILKLDALNQ